MILNVNYLFYLRAPKKSSVESPNLESKSNAPLPIYFRITVDGQRAEFSSGEFALSSNWNQQKGRVKGLGQFATATNQILEDLLAKAKEACRTLADKNSVMSAINIKNQMLGIGQNFHSVIQCFENFTKEIKLKIGSEYRIGTYKNYCVTLGHLKEFVNKSFHVKDLPLQSLNFKFITDFELMCQTEWECKRASTSQKHIQRIRKVIGIAIANDWIEKDPFILYKSKLDKPTIKYLTGEELKAIEEKKFVVERLDRVRDIFLFSCYTGYAYSDVEKFSPGDIVTGIDGLKWIYTNRAKNESKSNVPLLPKALEIIEKYKSHPDVLNKGKLLPVISNIKTNAYLKEIADVCGITKNLTFHMARHTFATTVTLTNGVPIETVSKMLGHASLKTTQIYAKVLENKISSDMIALRGKLAPTIVKKKTGKIAK